MTWIVGYCINCGTEIMSGDYYKVGSVGLICKDCKLLEELENEHKKR